MNIALGRQLDEIVGEIVVRLAECNLPAQVGQTGLELEAEQRQAGLLVSLGGQFLQPLVGILRRQGRIEAKFLLRLLHLVLEFFRVQGRLLLEGLVTQRALLLKVLVTQPAFLLVCLIAQARLNLPALLLQTRLLLVVLRAQTGLDLSLPVGEPKGVLRVLVGHGRLQVRLGILRGNRHGRTE